MRLKQLMQDRGMNQVDLSKRSGVGQNLISSYLRGAKQAQYPSLKNLLALATALHCTLEDLTGLPALRGAEVKLPELTPDALRFGKFFESLLDGDPLKEYLRKMSGQSESHDTEPGDTGKDKKIEP